MKQDEQGDHGARDGMTVDREEIRKKLGYDPIELLTQDDWGPHDPGVVMNDAWYAVATVGVEILRPLMAGEDLTHSARALWIFSELGKKGAVLVNDAIACLNHPWRLARRNVIEGLIYHHRQLTPEQIARVLVLAADPEILVREKVIQFIAAAPVAEIEAAHVFLRARDDYDQHGEGLAFLTGALPVDKAIATLAKGEAVTCCYVYASFLAKAHAEHYLEIPGEISGDLADRMRKRIELRKWINERKKKKFKPRLYRRGGRIIFPEE